MYGGQYYCSNSHMRSNKVCNQVEGDAPPDGPEYVGGEVVHATEKANGVVDLGEVLEEEHYQKHRHHCCRRGSLSDQGRCCHPQYHLTTSNCTKLAGDNYIE